MYLQRTIIKLKLNIAMQSILAFSLASLHMAEILFNLYLFLVFPYITIPFFDIQCDENRNFYIYYIYYCDAARYYVALATL